MWLERLEGNGPWIETWLEHQRRDDYWKPASVCEDYGAIRCPVLAVGGWADGYTNAVFRLMEHLEVPRRGLIGPWGHKFPHMGVPGPAIGFLQELVRWWDHWLKGRETGIMDEPMLRVWMQDSLPPDSTSEDRPGRWVGEPSWPSPNIEERHYTLTPHRLVEGIPDGAEREKMWLQSPLSVGMFAGKWASYAATADLPYDQREEDGGALVFDSGPLEEPIEVFGLPSVSLEVSSDQPVAMLAVRLSDVAPNGEATRVTYGLLNLTHRNGDEHPEPLPIGEPCRVDIPLNGIAQVFPVGHRLRLSVSTSYWPLAWPPPARPQVTVMGGASTLSLPVRPPRPVEDAALPALPEPEAAPPIETTLMQPGHQQWQLRRDLTTDVSVLEVVNDPGTVRIEETGTLVRRATNEWFSFKGNDVLSVRGETRTDRGLERGDWRIRVTTRTVLTSTPSEFLVTAQLDAYELDERRGDPRVFSRNWHRVIPRDLV